MTHSYHKTIGKLELLGPTEVIQEEKVFCPIDDHKMTASTIPSHQDITAVEGNKCYC